MHSAPLSRQQQSLLSLSVLALFCLFSMGSAFADNMLAGNTDVGTYGFCVGSSCGSLGAAVAFTVGAKDQNFTSMDIWIDSYHGGNNPLVELTTAVPLYGGWYIPGTVLESWQGYTYSLPNYPSTTATNFSSGGGVKLTAGTTYMVVVYGDSIGEAWMESNTTTSLYSVTTYSLGLPWASTFGAPLDFAVYGTTVPEPASLLLLASGLPFVFRKLRQSKPTR
jgi:hypothetical protein